MTANPNFEGSDPSTQRTNQRTTFPPPPSFTAPKCPYLGNRTAAGQGTRIQDWWPNRLNVHLLRPMSDRANPLGPEFSYREAFTKELDYFGLKEDLKRLMTDSQEWWPADFGHYGPLFVRLAWHSAGTYRIQDGRGGAANGVLQVAPLHAWPDNANLDKARRLLWPLKQKYGSAISWADLIILAGNVALETMGYKVLGYAGGRVDMWRPDEATYWGSEKKWLKNDKRYTDGKDEAHNAVDMEVPLSEDNMGLVVYVNPEGPNHNPDPLQSAELIRETFRRMAMHDDETVALIAGGHTVGKCHGMVSNEHAGDDPEAAAINSMEQQGLGWRSYYKSGVGRDATTSGLEVTWSDRPIEFSNRYFEILFNNEWEHEKSPGGLHQWVAKDKTPIVPHAYDKGVKLPQRMLTIDLALRFDPIFEPISRRFLEHPEEFKDAFARAWFKLIHRDLGPIDRYLGPEIPAETFIWQDPITRHVGKHEGQDNSDLVVSRLTEADIAALKEQFRQRLEDGRVRSECLVVYAWGSASTFRCSDKRGGANGAHIRLQPQRSWAVNNPPRLERVLTVYEEIQRSFNGKGKSVVSIADLIVLGGCVAIEQAIRKNAAALGKADSHHHKHRSGGDKTEFYSNFTVPFSPGRGDATQEQTEIFSFAPMEPMADGFRNYNSVNALKSKSSTEDILVDRAQLLGLTIVEFTVLIGGLRVLGANYDDSKIGVLTETVGTLDNSFFVNLLTMDTVWKPVSIPAPEDSDMDKRLGSFNEDHRLEEASRFGFASEACKADIKKLEAANAEIEEQERRNANTFFGNENPDKEQKKRLEDNNADARREVIAQEMASRRDDARDGKIDPDQKKRREGVDEAVEEHKGTSLVGRIISAVGGGSCEDESRTYAEADNEKDAKYRDDSSKENVKKREAANEKNSIVKDKKADNVRDDKKDKPLAEYFEGTDRKTGALKWTASRADLVIGANSELRPIAEVYAQNGSNEKFIKDFVAAWCKVMDADRFDLETR